MEEPTCKDASYLHECLSLLAPPKQLMVLEHPHIQPATADVPLSRDQLLPLRRQGTHLSTPWLWPQTRAVRQNAQARVLQKSLGNLKRLELAQQWFVTILEFTVDNLDDDDV